MKDIIVETLIASLLGFVRAVLVEGGGPKFFQKLFVFAHSPMVAPTTGVPGSYIPVPALTQHSHSRQDTS